MNYQITVLFGGNELIQINPYKEQLRFIGYKGNIRAPTTMAAVAKAHVSGFL